MRKIISPQQSAFIPGRQIQDSIVVANEAFHYIRNKKRGNQNVMALKVDLNKAFDRVEWDFLLAVLRKMGFGDLWCNWICACLTTYELEFMVNGDYVGVIKPQRGLRQGDPVSPYLFIIIANVLSRQISRAMTLGTLSGIKMVRNCPLISHIFFADDSLFFLKASLSNGGDSDEHHIHWKNWKKLSQSKHQGGLGFRDFEAFNMALLAKQGWRLLINPDAFWGRILKGIYFLNSNFLVAKKGSHPSWFWSSLLHGRDLLLQGVRWQVGNGRRISFWTQKWVPFSDDFYIRSPLGPFHNRHNRNTVSDFIENGHWNVRKLREHILATEAEMVLQIPISQTGSSDKLIWHFDPKGQYTVKSGYKQAIALISTSVSIGESSANPSSKFWKVIWHIPVQPKIKLFLWKAISNSVATKEN
ncbi:RNA-directed DNA polymerase, eukaryota, reverse transcriptase zinc-binding domain protein [Tanacetum coccineum]